MTDKRNNFLRSTARSTLRSFSIDIRPTPSSTSPLVRTDVKLFPYGDPRFHAIREANQFFVDKTGYLKIVEKEMNSTFVRPPRFGKSLFASMLASYADIATTDEQYDRWFGGTEIYEVRFVYWNSIRIFSNYI